MLRSRLLFVNARIGLFALGASLFFVAIGVFFFSEAIRFVERENRITITSVPIGEAAETVENGRFSAQVTISNETETPILLEGSNVCCGRRCDFGSKTLPILINPGGQAQFFVHSPDSESIELDFYFDAFGGLVVRSAFVVFQKRS